MLTEHTMQEVAARAASVLRAGGVVLYPTDTLYGLGADALSDEAVGKVFQIKGRDEGKPIHAIVADTDMASRYADVSGAVRSVIEKLPKGQVTYIVPKLSGIDSGIAKDISTFGFRIPDNVFCIEMLRAFGGPVTATSANRAGEEPERSVDAILAQIAPEKPDLVIDVSELPARKPSTVVDVSSGMPMLVREGVLKWSDFKTAFEDIGAV